MISEWTGVEIKWVGPPRSYTAGRPRPIQFVTLHYTAGSEGPTSAEAGAAYDKARTDGTSCHAFTDSAGPVVQEVRDGDTAHSAFYHGNAIGLHVEICGTAQTRAQWLDATSRATLETTALLVAHWCHEHDLPPVRLTTAQTRAAWYAAAGKRPKGINDHGTVTAAFPEDGGTHTDVGAGFPWDVFMTMVEEAYAMELTAVSKDGLADLLGTDGVIESQAEAGDNPETDKGFTTWRTRIKRDAVKLQEVKEAVAVLAKRLDDGTSVTLNDAQMAELRAGIAADVIAELRALQWVASSPQP